MSQFALGWRRHVRAALALVGFAAVGCADNASGGPGAPTQAEQGNDRADASDEGEAQAGSASSLPESRDGGGAPGAELEPSSDDVERPVLDAAQDDSRSEGARSDAGSGEAGVSDDDGFGELGVCGQRSAGTVTADDFQTYEEFYLLGDEGFGGDICVVRFDVVRVGDAPDGCDESSGQEDGCLWTHQVEYRDPEVTTDEGEVCAHSELGLDAEAIAAIDGRRLSYGYVSEYQGHNSVLMVYNEQDQVWEPRVNAGWSEESGAFQFDRRDGFCGY